MFLLKYDIHTVNCTNLNYTAWLLFSKWIHSAKDNHHPDKNREYQNQPRNFLCPLPSHYPQHRYFRISFGLIFLNLIPCTSGCPSLHELWFQDGRFPSTQGPRSLRSLPLVPREVKQRPVFPEPLTAHCVLLTPGSFPSKHYHCLSMDRYSGGGKASLPGRYSLWPTLTSKGKSFEGWLLLAMKAAPTLPSNSPAVSPSGFYSEQKCIPLMKFRVLASLQK